MLIIGASSFVGSNLLDELKSEFRVIGTYFKHPISIPGVLCLPCDVLKKEMVSTVVSRLRPDVVIYAAGMSSLKEASHHIKEAESLNSVGAVNCLMAAERVDAKFVYLSSAFVFGGGDALNKEGDVPFPNTNYGNNLSSTEFYIQRSSLNYLILRSSVLYGRGYSPVKETWFESLEKAFFEQKKVSLDDQVVTGFLDVRIFARILILVLKAEITNRLLNISSRDYSTRFQFAKKYGEVFKKDSGFLGKVTGEFPLEKNASTEEELNFKLDTTNIEGLLGIAMPSIEESLESTLERFKS